MLQGQQTNRPSPQQTRSYLVIAAAASASLFFPWVLIHQFNSSERSCASSSAEDSEALKALVLLAQRNSAALRNLSCDDIDQSVISMLDRVQRTLSASFDSAASSQKLPTPARELPASSSSELSVPVEAPSGAIWLRFAIVSIARSHNADYLLRTLHAIVEEMPAEPAHPMRTSTDIVVVNNNHEPGEHLIFEQAARTYAHAARFIVKKPRSPPLRCPRAPKAGGSHAPPKASVQQQSCDLVSAFEALLNVRPAAAHLMLLEDDWLLCPHGLASVHHAIDKAYRYDPRWLALRVSYGFNGVVVSASL